jgi:hypothetical protein
MLAKLDRRSKEARLMATARDELTRHVGGRPSAAQRIVIERACRLQLYLEVMDRETLATGTMTERNSKQYLAWCNALRLCMRELGMKGRAAPASSDGLAEYLAGKVAAE